MSKEQIEDVKTINKVLSVDEERTIEKLISKISEFEAFRENISNAREKISSPDERSKVWIKKALHDIGIKPSIRLSMKAIENEKEEKT
jgi:phage gp16-like protein